MTLERSLRELVRVVLAEAEQNAPFRERLENALGLATASPASASQNRSRPHRRATPLLDPVDLARLGEANLRARLAELTLEQLRDIMAAHGMDPGRLAMKWKSPARVIDRIVEFSLNRAQKGDAFLPPT